MDKGVDKSDKKSYDVALRMLGIHVANSSFFFRILGVAEPIPGPAPFIFSPFQYTTPFMAEFKE